MTKRTTALLAAILAALVLGWLAILAFDGGSTDGSATIAPAAREEVARTRTPPAGALSGAREPALGAGSGERPASPAAGLDEVEAEPRVPEAAVESTTSHALTGRVVDVDARPIAGVAIVWRDAQEEVLARSAADGSFRIELAPEDLQRRRTLVVAEPGLAHVRTSLVQEARLDAEHLIVVAPAVDVGGTVLDEGGRPLAGARVDLVFAPMVGFPHALETTRLARRTTEADEHGTFVLERAPTHERFELRAAATDHVDARRPMPASSRADLVFVLAAAEAEASPTLTGVVLHVDGRPAPSATVALGRDRTLADEAGRFSLALGTTAPGKVPLVAFKTGYQAAVRHDVVSTYVDRGLSPPPLELVLGPATLSIEGEVRDAAGTPCVGWVVSLLDGEEASVHRAPPVFVEDLVRAGPREIVTDDRGRFLVEGLSARDYTLRAYDRESLVQVRSGAVPAGSRVVLRVPEGACRERLSGRVLATDGTPVGGVRVRLAICTARSGPSSAWWSGAPVETDALGRFELRDVPRHDVSLSLEGAAIVGARHELDADGPDDGHTFEAIRRCRFRVVWPAAQPGDGFALLDGDEAALPIVDIRASSSSSTTVWPLEDGESPPLSANETATAIVLIREGEEVARHPARLEPGELTVIRP